jgi:hypothetical protein
VNKTILFLVLLTSVIIVSASFYALAGPGGDGGQHGQEDDDPTVPEPTPGNPAPFEDVNLSQVAKFQFDLMVCSEKQSTTGWYRISGGEMVIDTINYTDSVTGEQIILTKNDTKVYKLEPMKEKAKDSGKKKYIHVRFLNEFDEVLGEINVFPPRNDIFNLDNHLEDGESRDTVLEFDDGDVTTNKTYFHAFPMKWEGPSLNATGNGTLKDSITLACEWVELELP